LVLDVRHVHTEVIFGDVALRVGPDVAILLCLPGGEALRQLGLTRVKFFSVTFIAEFKPEAFEKGPGALS
jgi:hypothetical protein